MKHIVFVEAVLYVGPSGGELVPFCKKPCLCLMTSFLIKVEIDYCAHIT